MNWGHFRIEQGGGFKRLYAFVKVLGYSRMCMCSLRLTSDWRRLWAVIHGLSNTSAASHEHACTDNMKTVVAGHDENGEVIWNERVARFAEHYGFVLRRCKPYRARTKGKVENGVGYVRKNFWPRVRTFSGLQDLNQQVRHWLDTVAKRRLHGTTVQVPWDLWKQENLQPVTEVSFAYADRFHRKVAADCYVSYAWRSQKDEVLLMLYKSKCGQIAHPALVNRRLKRKVELVKRFAKG